MRLTDADARKRFTRAFGPKVEAAICWNIFGVVINASFLSALA
jgi:hypothetical protein